MIQEGTGAGSQKGRKGGTKGKVNFVELELLHCEFCIGKIPHLLPHEHISCIEL